MIFGFDIESVGSTNQFICGTVCYRTKAGNTKYETFKQKDKMEEWIINKGKTLRKDKKNMSIYAHNLQFDFFRMADLKKAHIKGKTEGYKIICMGGVFLVDYVDKEGKTILSFNDTYCIMNKRLVEVGEILGYKKEELKEATKTKLFNNETEMEEFTFEELNEIVYYNRIDAEICLRLIEFVKEFLELENYKPRKIITAGQISMSLFNRWIAKNKYHKYLFKWQDDPNKIYFGYEYELTKYPEDVYEACRGGRVEVIQTGEFNNTTNIDINSLYPLCYTKIPFPNIKKETKVEKPLEIYSQRELFKIMGVSKVLLECPKQELGYLPIRVKVKNNIQENVYPKHKCEMLGTWTNFEIKNALKLGYKIKFVEWSILYEEIEINPLKEFTERMYEKRLKSNIGKSFYKLILNNIHGKFLQRMRLKEWLVDDIGNSLELGQQGYEIYTRIDDYNCLYSKNIGKKYGRNYCPILSAYITAYSRDIIYREMRKIDIKDLLYVAVDGILYKGDYINKFKFDNKMGNMKIVNKFNTQLKGVKSEVFGKNNYIVGKDIRISGISKAQLEEYKGQRIIKFERFKNIRNTDTLKESFEKEKLTKDLDGLINKTKELNNWLNKKNLFLDSETDLEYYSEQL